VDAELLAAHAQEKNEIREEMEIKI